MAVDDEKRSVEIFGRYGWVFLGIALFVIVVLLPLPGLSRSGRIVLATAALMAVWWMTEAAPIPATALLPLVVFPAFGVLSAKEAAAPYGNHNIFLFLGGFFIARAMERHNLHRRIAIKILLAVGVGRRKIVLGFILATAFLSMWISNTASTMIMIPIALAVLDKLGESDTSFAKALFLGIAYGATCGGIATLVGTPPNIVLAGQMRNLFPKAPPLTFASWLAVGMPVTVTLIPIVWLVLTRVAFRVEPGAAVGKEVLLAERRTLGRMSREEKAVFAVFALVVLGWIFRRDLNLGFITIPGWSTALGVGRYVGDATVAIAGALLLFLLPARGGGRVLEWRTAAKIPWGIVLLFGGGFSLAKAFGASGLSRWVGELLAGLGNLPLPLLVLLVTTTLAMLTEFTSNTATATLMIPILASAAVGMKLDPRLLMFPTTLAVSCAFMLPVATPPNAIVFASGKLAVKDMVRAGIFMNLAGIVLITAFTCLLVAPLLGLKAGVLPPWAQ